MGSSVSTTRVDDRTRQIDADMARLRVEMAVTIKMLLLGTGESGKSTVLRQMRIHHAAGLTTEDFESIRPTVVANILHNMATLIAGVQQFEIAYECATSPADAELIHTTMNENPAQLERHVADALTRLWWDGGIQQVYARRSEIQLADSAAYYFNERLTDVATPDYIPTQDDFLRCRVATSGIVEVPFVIKEKKFRVFDVGGQRSERKKWIHCFDGVNAVLFIVAISEYDQVLMEDGKTNRLLEARDLFELICNSSWFTNSTVILFLNKIDIFQEKLRVVPLTVFFKKYTGAMEYEPAIEYISERFTSINRNVDRKIFTHPTCATDTTQVKKALDGVVTVILDRAVSKTGLY